MSIADFVLAFVGIIIGLGVADLLVSLHKLLRAGSRVKWHWATPALAGLMLLVTLVMWWRSFLWFSGLASETIAAFLPRFLAMIIVFLMMAAALPDDVPEDGIDLRQFYLSSRVHLWSLMTLTFTAVVLIEIADHWAMGLAGVFAIFWPTMMSLALAAIATFTPRMWVHALAIGWIYAVVAYNNLFIAIGQ
jgi:hypothetical protein